MIPPRHRAPLPHRRRRLAAPPALLFLALSLAIAARIHRAVDLAYGPADGGRTSGGGGGGGGGGVGDGDGPGSSSAAAAAAAHRPPASPPSRLPPGHEDDPPRLPSTAGADADPSRPAYAAALADAVSPPPPPPPPPLFNPEEFRTARYVNLPVTPASERAEIDDRIRRAAGRPAVDPAGLMHVARPPGRDAVVGLAAYPRNMGAFRRIVRGLRNSGYDGHIILGVHADIPPDERRYLREMDVTFYAVEFVDCDESVPDVGKVRTAVRGKCSKGLEDLTLEWGRYEMARQWLNACKECTGWAMVMDTRDIFFQAHPFAALPEPSLAKHNLLFIEEVSRHTSPIKEKHRYFTMDNGRYTRHIFQCYGKLYGTVHWRKYADRPVLCSGTVIGNREGMHRFLSVLVDEFYANNAKENKLCRSPHTTDQWIMDYLYYTGQFGYPNRTATVPWGMGPVLTIGKACVNNRMTPSHSQKDMVSFDADHFILNAHESNESKARIAPSVHQFDRCALWVRRWFRKHPNLFDKDEVLHWKIQ